MAVMTHDLGDFKLQITSLFIVRNIKCGYSFSKLGREEQVDTKFKSIRRNFLFCIKTASCAVSPLKMTLLGIEFDVISFNDVIC